jgi:hypothetical protein
VRWLALAFVLGACRAHESLPPATALDQIRPLALPMPRGAVRDCRPSPEIRRWLAHAAHSGLRACGTLELGAPSATAHHCVTASLERREPFVVEQQLADGDRVVAYALVGVLDPDGAFAVYRADYEEPRCIGDCPIIRNLRISACHAPVLQPCAEDLSRCARCDHEVEFTACSLYDNRAPDG